VTSPLDAYFAALDAGDDAAATACFAADATYIRPALETAGLDVISGRDRIAEFLELRRERQRQGEYAHRHELRSAAVEARECFVEADMVADTGTVGIFMAHATFDDDGLIARYIAIMAALPDGALKAS